MIVLPPDSTSLSAWLSLALIGGYVALWVHEGSHYFVGKLGGTGPRIRFKYWVFPVEVTHVKIETMDSGIIRLSGLSPFLWVPSIPVACIVFAITLHPVVLLLLVVLSAAVLGSSVSDARAFCDPEAFRHRSIEGELDSTMLVERAVYRAFGRIAS